MSTMMRFAWTSAFVAFALVIGLACSSAKSSATPPVAAGSCASTVASFSACGGSLLGTWALSAFCVAGAASTDPTDGGCPGASLTGGFSPSGSITFNADGTYSQTVLEVSLTQNLVMPTSCLGSSACDPGALLGSGDGGTATCATSGADCTCSGTKPQSPSPAMTGKYTVTGTSFAAGFASPTPYCVQDNKLYVGTQGSGSAVQQVLVATKQ